MKSLLKTFILVGIVLIGFSSCKKDEDKPEDTPNVVVNKNLISKTITIDARAYDAWVYINLESGKVVKPTNFLDDLSWDIAFHRDNVRTNGGESGKGMGAGMETEYEKLSDCKSAPESGYATDEQMDIMTAYVMPPEYEKQPANVELEKWGNFDITVMPPVFKLSGKVYTIKTAKGNYAKLKFHDYYNDEGESGYIKVEYVLQTNGKTSFQ
ncbi:MAG: HmuY family protein [Hyphomicrobiales bacterium]